MERNRHQATRGGLTRRRLLGGVLGVAGIVAGVPIGAEGLHVVETLNPPEKSLSERIVDVSQADAFRFDMHDNTGIGMDHLKIEQIGQGRYVGVYHHQEGGELVYSFAY